MTTERTWEVRNIDGSNPRQMTLARYRAELDAAKAKAMIAFKSVPQFAKIAAALKA
jgi:hypothetical protein